ncbi:VOC family protein [bacterium]|nr:VOC family protein [bacterium]
MKLLHTMVRVLDIEKSLDFYTKLFDMKIKEKRRLEDCWLYFLRDEQSGYEIELTYNDEAPKQGYDLGNGFGHFAFGVDDMNEFTKKMKSYGYEYLYEPFDLTGKGSNIAFLKDPDGYEIEIIEKVNW